jgi:hypothetical protein
MDDNALLQPQSIEEIKAQNEVELQAEKETTSLLAAVTMAQGWEQVDEKFNTKIEALMSGAVCRELVMNAEVSNERLGELYRASYLAGKNLLDVYTDITTAVETAHGK